MITYDNYDFLGFGIRGYRCFSDKSARIGPFGKVHVVAGQNNSGKSTLVNVATRILKKISALGDLCEVAFIDEDKPKCPTAIWPLEKLDHGVTLARVSLCFNKHALISKAMDRPTATEEGKRELEHLLGFLSEDCEDDDTCWIDYDLMCSTGMGIPHAQYITPSTSQVQEEDLDSDLIALQRSLGIGVGEDFDTGFKLVIAELIPWASVRNIVEVAAFRRADWVLENREDGSGQRRLIETIHGIRESSQERQQDSDEELAYLNDFLRYVLNDEAMCVRTDKDDENLLVAIGGSTFLNLENLGTGIEEVVTLAAAATFNRNAIIVVEEPELHLHPTTQARLMQRLMGDQHGNRFIVTTHSPTIINTPGATISQVYQQDGVSYSRQITQLREYRAVLDDIGAKPSDLLQASYVIWVEGPSDRIYVNYWISIADSSLVEGIHYSIMFYGGRLLNHLSADSDSEADELIALFKISTHFCVLMDSDRKSKNAEINATKRRIVEECAHSNCLSWVTDFRTIENYVPADVLEEAINEVHPGKVYEHSLGEPYECPLGGTFKGVDSRPDKVKVARYVTDKGYCLEMPLRGQVDNLVEHIRRANKMGQ